MVIKHLSSYSLATALFLAHQTQALPFVDADAFAPGDKKAIYESSSGLTWLDFGITNDKSFDQVISELDSTYYGWRLPTEDEVKNLWNSTINTNNAPPWSEYDHEYIEHGSDAMHYQDIFDLWGANVVKQNQNEPSNFFQLFFYQCEGMLLTSEGKLITVSITEEAAYLNHQQANQSFLHETFAGTNELGELTSGYAGKYLSTLLVRDGKPVTVPEPMPSLLMLFGLIAVTASRRLKLKNRGK